MLPTSEGLSLLHFNSTVLDLPQCQSVFPQICSRFFFRKPPELTSFSIFIYTTFLSVCVQNYPYAVRHSLIQPLCHQSLSSLPWIIVPASPLSSLHPVSSPAPTAYKEINDPSSTLCRHPAPATPPHTHHAPYTSRAPP